MDEVSVISRIIKLEIYVGIISRSRKLRLITLTETSIILDIRKTNSNVSNCFYHTLKKGNNIFLCLALIPSVYGKTR